MTDPRRFAVPLEQLDGVRVEESEQVQEQPTGDHPDAGAWSSPQVHPFGDGLDTDGE